MKRWFAVIGVIFGVGLLACSAAPVIDVSSSGGPPPSPHCAEGEPCSTDPSCCSGALLLICSGGVYQRKQQCDALTEECSAAEQACTCDPGATRCDPSSSSVRQVCRASSGSVGKFEPEQCPPGTKCVDGICPSTDCDLCTEGEVTCSPNKTAVLECQRDPTSKCARFVERFLCSAHGMKCILPSLIPQKDIDYCVNECGGRGIELSATSCSEDPKLACGTLICDPATGTLKSDHTGCLAGGLTCTSDAQCASCDCTSNKCIGNGPLHCPEALACPW